MAHWQRVGSNTATEVTVLPSVRAAYISNPKAASSFLDTFFRIFGFVMANSSVAGRDDVRVALRSQLGNGGQHFPT